MNIRIASLRVRLLLLVGLSFYWPMLTSCKLRIKAYAISDYDATVYVLMYFAAVTLLGVAFAVVKGAGHWLAMHGKAGVALGACASLALLPGVFAPSTPVLGVLLVAPSIFLAALSFCICTVGWGVAVLSPVYADNRKTFLVDVAITFFLGYALPIFLLDLFPDLDASVVPEALGALGPLVSSACLALVLGGETQGAQLREGTPADSHGHVQAAPPLVAIATLIMVCSTLIGLFSRTAEVNDLRADYALRHAYTLIFSLLFIACMYMAMRYPRFKAMTWGTTLLLVMSGMFLPVSCGESLLTCGIDILVVGRLLIWLLYWALLVDVAKREHRSVVRLMGGFFLAVRGLSCILTDLLHYVLPSEFVFSLGTNQFMVCAELALLGCALVVIGLMTSTGLDGAGETEKLPTDDGARRREVCLSIAQEYGLTERETSVLEYLSMGYTMQRIAELQYVAQNTVRSHVKGLYRKLGCHSKQEVIESVNRRLSELGSGRA